MTVPCPICLIEIPAPETDEVSSSGLSVAVDGSFVTEHIAMHERCTCMWEITERLPELTEEMFNERGIHGSDVIERHVRREHNDECEVHG